LEYGEDTAWSKPILESMSIDSINSIILDENNFYFKKTTQMTECLLERGKGHFIVGYTDLHPNGDAIAAFRDPQRLLLDTIEYKEEIKILSRKITRDFLKVYDIFHKQISKYGMPSTCWLPAISKGKFHIPSCDISCMISNEAFENLFLESIIEECRYMDNNIYHLDGPQALRYLDTLLDIPEIHAIQWVPGAGQDYWANWIEVYQKIQNKNKAMYILSVPAQDLDKLFEILRPEGVWIGNITEVQTIEQANEILNKIERWG
jgi:hypothetical protein